MDRNYIEFLVKIRVAFKMKIGWGTARSVLLNMALKRRITALKTTKSFIFILNKAEKTATFKGV